MIVACLNVREDGWALGWAAELCFEGQAFLLFKFWIWGEFSSRKLRHNLIKWCLWEHLLDQILKGLRVRGAGLKLSIGSIDDLLCCWCIECYAWLNNNGTKVAFLSDIFVLTYSFWLVPNSTCTITGSNLIKGVLPITWRNHRLPSPTRIKCMGESVSQSVGVPLAGKP